MNNDIKIFALRDFDYHKANMYVNSAYCGEYRHESTECIFQKPENAEEKAWMPTILREIKEGYQLEMYVALQRIDKDISRECKWVELGTIQDHLEIDHCDGDGSVFILTNKGMFTNSKDFEREYKNLINEREVIKEERETLDIGNR